ncbi:hypothetical protein [Actinomadura sp. GTD37]|uniref:hypothetical protein n=1 Tax=Actinomadura sp. GTD37 TaxID=1778030 RepID=UPI0035C0008F
MRSRHVLPATVIAAPWGFTFVPPQGSPGRLHGAVRGPAAGRAAAVLLGEHVTATRLACAALIIAGVAAGSVRLPSRPALRTALTNEAA